MKNRISILIESLLDKKIREDELHEIYQILNNEEKEELINSHFQQYVTEKDEKIKIDSHSIYREIKKNLPADNLTQESDTTLFNYLSLSKSRRTLSFVPLLRYAAAITLAVLSTWWVIRSLDNKNLPVENQLCIITTPLGSRTSVVLPDGSKVWLNSGSTLRYLAHFREDQRSAFLEGEAYFEISKDKQRPFIVNTVGPEIRVLGTKFNVKGYADDNIVITTLFEGKIKLMNPKEKSNDHKEYTLHPKQEARYNKATNEIMLSEIKKPEKKSLKKINTAEITSKLEPVMAWKDGKLIFENESLEEITIKLHRWYGVNIQITDDKLRNGRYSGVFKNNETIYQVLETINKITPLEINAKDNHIYISSKP